MRSDEYFAELVLFRQGENGVITASEIELGQLLLPHLRRAVTISKLLDIKTVLAGTLGAVLDTLSTAVLLVRCDSQIVHANRAAEALLSAGDAMIRQAGNLKLHSTGAAAALLVAIAQATANESVLDRKGMNIPIQRSTGESLVLHVLPLRQGKLRPGLMPGAVAAIFIAPPAARPMTACTALAALFGLTHLELTVLGHVVQGKTSAQIAQKLGIGVATVKTHLQHVFDKTGVRRQTELAALAASFALPLDG